MLIESIAVVLAIILVAAKFRVVTLRRILAYHAVLDVVVTVGLVMMLSGSFAGIMIAIFAGAMMSLILTFARRILGYEKRVIRKCNMGHNHITWERVPGKFNVSLNKEKVHA
jgi:hypothetical protein